MPRVAPIPLAVLLSGCCCPEEPPYNPYAPGRVTCGQINAAELIGLREREAAGYARDGGCAMRVVTRDGRVLVPPEGGSLPAPDAPVTEVSVTVRDGYVHRLGR